MGTTLRDLIPAFAKSSGILALKSASLRGAYPPPCTYFTFADQVSNPRIAESLNDLSPLPPTSVTIPTLIGCSPAKCGWLSV